MSWIELSVIVAAVAVVYYMRRGSKPVERESAAAYLKAGALLIDVRSAGEFASGHLHGAINVPLNRIETALKHRVPDKDQVLLLYCQSGMRSSAASGQLKALGYSNAFNLGSYSRAAKICESE
jgi:phage shock protein E